MKSLYKVYKSREVIVGNTRAIEFIGDNIVHKKHDSLIVQEDKSKANKAMEERAKEILDAAELEAKELVENAKREVDMIIEEAYQDAKDIYNKAKNEGYNEGLTLGRQKGYEEFHMLLEEAKTIKQGIYQTQKELAKSLETEIIDLVIYCVKKVIDYELDKNHELLLNLIEKGLQKCTFTETLVVRGNEKEYEVLNSYKSRIYMMTEGIDDLIIKKDLALKKGSIIIETLSGKIDASVDTQIKQIEGLFKELLKSEGLHEGDSTE
ncbi:FliH/SctL family protein [Natronincola ferrireducens]|nr:FliH/SctL family protein [Natronincola ferrireducens]